MNEAKDNKTPEEPIELIPDDIIPAEALTEKDEAQEPEDIKTELTKKAAELTALEERYKRVWADHENYKRNKEKECQEQYDYGRMSIIRDTLPILDSMEKAVAAAKDEATRQGVELIVKLMNDSFTRWGVKTIDRTGEKFDPLLENAVIQGEEGEGEPGTVLTVFQKGYSLNGKVIRHAMVKVAQG